jgi:predicted DNA binding CopG/RHH family protein
MSNRTTSTIPTFATEEEEREFWATQDLADFFDLESASPVSFPQLRPSLQTISLRLPVPLLGDLKVLANKQDVPYQSLLKMFLAERVRQELAPHSTRGRLTMTKGKVTSKAAAKSASKTLRNSTSPKAKSAAASALVQTKAPAKTTSKAAATKASKTLSDGRTSKAAKSAAGSALAQKVRRTK